MNRLAELKKKQSKYYSDHDFVDEDQFVFRNYRLERPYQYRM